MGEKVRRFYTPDVEMRVRDNDDGSVTLIGHAAVFNKWSKDMMGFREKVAPGAFTRTLKEGGAVRSYWNHNRDFVLGNSANGTLRLWEDEIGLACEIDAPNTPTIRDLVIEPIRRGDVDEMSFAFSAPKGGDKWEHGAEMDERTLIDLNLFDASPVAEGAYADTDISARSADYEEQRARWNAEMKDFETERKRVQAIELNRLDALDELYS